MDFKNLIDLQKKLKDEQVCIDAFEKIRWPDKVISPYDSTSTVTRSSNNRFWCKNTKKYFNVRTGTIFQCSNVPLSKWFVAIYAEVTNKRGVNSVQLAKDIGVTQKTSWFMAHRIRESLRSKEPFMLEGIVQVDESFVGGKNKNRHKAKKVVNSQGRSFKDKTPVLGILQQGGKLITQVIADTKASTLEPEIRSRVKEDSVLLSDEWRGYKYMRLWYEHCIVDHSARVYANDGVTTNGVENFWSHLKRGLNGVYYQVSRKHLQKYCDEFTFRFNTREMTSSERFVEALRGNTTRLTYKDLVR